MKKLTVVLFALFTAVAASGCAEDHSPFNSPDQQRAHSDKAQGELSSGVSK